MLPAFLAVCIGAACRGQVLNMDELRALAQFAPISSQLSSKAADYQSHRYAVLTAKRLDDLSLGELLELAQCCHRLGKDAEGCKVAEAGAGRIAAKPAAISDAPAEIVLRARFLVEMGYPLRALAILAPLEAKDPKEFTFWVACFDAYMLRSPKQVDTLLQGARSDPVSAADKIREVLDADPAVRKGLESNEKSLQRCLSKMRACARSKFDRIAVAEKEWTPSVVAAMLSNSPTLREDVVQTVIAWFSEVGKAYEDAMDVLPPNEESVNGLCLGLAFPRILGHGGQDSGSKADIGSARFERIFAYVDSAIASDRPSLRRAGLVGKASLTRAFGKPADSLRVWVDFVKAHPEDVAAVRCLLATIRDPAGPDLRGIRSEDLVQAWSVGEKAALALLADRDEVPVRLVLAACYRSRNALTKCREQIDAILKAKASDPVGNLCMAALLLGRSDYMSHLIEIGDRLDRAFANKPADDPTFTAAYCTDTAIYLAVTGESERAADVLELGVKADPTYGPIREVQKLLGSAP